MPTTPTGTLRGAIRADGQAKASTARTITAGSATDTISICRHGGWAANGFLIVLRLHTERSFFIESAPVPSDLSRRMFVFLYDRGMPRVTQQHRDERREQILAAARRCFLRDGFHGTSMQDLFAESGLSAGAVYGYFASKDDVIVAIAEENLQDVVEMIHTVAARQPDQSIGTTLAGLLEVVRVKHLEDGLGGLAVLVWAEALRNESLRERFTALLTQLRTDLTKAVRVHQRAGDITSEVRADAIAALLIGAVPGYIVQLALLGPQAVSRVPDAARALFP